VAVLCALAGLTRDEIAAAERPPTSGVSTESRAAGGGPHAPPAGSWPQQGGCPQHANFTHDSPAPPYSVAWIADLAPEMIYAAQPVVADRRVYHSTLQGSVYALDLNTGERLWHFKTGDCMWGGAAAGTAPYGGTGKVFVASWEGLVFGLDAKTGEKLWQFDAEENISASPCVADDSVFIGTRQGTMLALSTGGQLQWKQKLSWNLYTSAAWNNGRVYAVTEDMVAHAMDARTGALIWKSAQLAGLAIRDFYPVAHGGWVLVTTEPAVAAGKKQTLPKEAIGRPVHNGERPTSLVQAEAALLEELKDHPAMQTLFLLNESDGKQPFVPLNFYGGAGLEQVNQPLTFDREGRLVRPCEMAGGMKVARIDLVKNQVWDIMDEFQPSATDNSEILSVGGTRVFSKNYIRGGHGQWAGFVFDYTHREMSQLPHRQVPAKRVSVVPLAWAPSCPLSERRMGYAGEMWGIQGVSPTVIAGNRFYWVKQAQQIIAVEGR
jgi:hypothetical protein